MTTLPTKGPSTVTLKDSGDVYTIASIKELAGLVAAHLKQTTPELSIAVVKAIGANLGRWLSGTGKTEEFDDIAQLATRIHTAAGRGPATQDKGEDLEASAAAHINGAIAGTDTVPTWAKPFVKTRGGQDPDLYSGKPGDPSVKHMLKVDVWSESAVGIVGGPAKNKNEGMFQQICTSLQVVCEAHGKTPYVFADEGTSEAILEIAKKTVGGGTVLTRVGGGPWQPA